MAKNKEQQNIEEETEKPWYHHKGSWGNSYSLIMLNVGSIGTLLSLKNWYEARNKDFSDLHRYFEA